MALNHPIVTQLAIIDSDDGLSPGRRQSIIWTSAGILLVWTLRTKLMWNSNRNSYIFIQENAFENIVCEMSAILSRPQYVNVLILSDAYTFQWTASSMLQAMDWRLLGSILIYSQKKPHKNMSIFLYSPRCVNPFITAGAFNKAS